MSKIQKSRLGRGLGSLISISDLPIETEIASQPSPEPTIPSAIASASPATNYDARHPESNDTPYRMIPVEHITPNPHQPRRVIDETKIAELAASLKGNGVIQPVIVRQMPDGYQLVAGERRWRAAQLAGLSTLPAIVRTVSSFEQAQMALVENIQREDLNPIDRASSYRTLIDQLGLTQHELATRLGEDRSTIANHLRLLELAEPVRAMLRAGHLSLGHAKLLAGMSDIVEQVRLADMCVAQELSVRNLERLMSDKPTGNVGQTTPVLLSAHAKDLEKSISRQLGMRAQLREGRKKGRGRLIIHYANLDQFDTLLGKLDVKIDE